MADFTAFPNEKTTAIQRRDGLTYPFNGGFSSASLAEKRGRNARINNIPGRKP
jgi:hypothetical protein